METNNRPGGFFLIGGKSKTCFATLVNLAGGVDARIVVIPHASGVPDEASADVLEALGKLGVTQASVLRPPSRLRARLAAGLWNIGLKRLSRFVSDTCIDRNVDAVFITGGDQSRLVELLGPGGIAALERFSQDGGLISGTSAGAACMGYHMITGGMRDGKIRPDSLKTGKGLGLMKRISFDTHMVRDRFNRPIVALATLDIDGAIGLDEDTGVHIVGPHATVYGVGKVWYYRPTEAFACDLESGTYGGLQVRECTAGDTFSL